MNMIAAFAGFAIACSAAFTLHVFFFSPISPDALHLPSPSSIPSNKELQNVRRVGEEGVIEGPEDLFVDKGGVIHTIGRDGWVRRMQIHGDGCWERWKQIHSYSALGITPSNHATAGVLIADAQLYYYETNCKMYNTHEVRLSEVRFADEVVESGDGSVYISVPSTKFGYHNWYLDVLEAKPNGQILKYDPFTGRTTVLLDHLCFPNGLVLPKEEDCLIFCETWKFRCQKYWLTGARKGTTEIFVDNLPGGPDNIHLAPDGSFWIGVIQVVSPGHEFVHTSKLLKHMVASTPRLLGLVSRAPTTMARVVKVGADGRIIKMLEDPDGKLMSFVTTAFEFEGHLYLGSLANNFLGKLALNVTK
ncbi:unnamed protein product [Linum tenue]|uniref:Strictosidine synthase conserved region domain-containing protein n=1 Tax=Linum tenue TaxID=586396 RepID=A0AAV0IWT1_9ROSI|nr:unnamed protein product [Linum tenue]